MSQMPEDGSSPYGDLPYVMSGLKRRNSQYDRQRQLAYGMMQGGIDFSPVQHPMQGVSRLAQALVGSLMAGRADSMEAEADKQRQAAIGEANKIADPQERMAAYAKIDPEIGMKFGAQMAMQQAAAKRKAEENQQAALALGNAYGGGGMPAGGGQQQAAMPPEQAKAQATQYVNYLVQNHGFAPEQAAAMVGNLFQESGFNPNAVHDNGTGFGMGGWRLDRRDALLNAAKQAGKNPGDPQFQLDFFAQELKGRPEFAQFQQAQTPQERQAALMTYFRPAGWTPQAPQNGNGFGNRVQFAQTFAPGQPQVAQGDNVLPSPRPPGAVADASGTPLPPQTPPRPTEIPPPDPNPAVVRRAIALRSAGQITSAQADAMINDDINRRWQFAQQEASADRRQAASEAAAAQREDAKGPQKAFENATTLRKEYSSEPVVKQYRTVVPMLEAAKDATTRPTRAADINLVYAFAKLMDPDSVVRESETGMVMATGTVADKIGSYLGQLNGGPMLKPETRANLIKELESRFGPMQESYNQITGAYGKIAESAGLPREHVILPVRPDGKAPALPGAGPTVGASMPPPPPGFRPVGR